MNSPYEPLFPAGAGGVPQAFRDQFLIGPDDPLDVRLEGHVDVSRQAWLGPLFYLLSRFGLLLAQTGARVPVTLEIVPGRDARGRPWQLDRRRFGFPEPERFDTLTLWDERRRQVVDLTGPLGAVQIVWDARFVPPGTLRFEHGRFALGGRGWRIVLPRAFSRWLLGDATFVQTLDSADPNAVRIAFTLAHPLLGTLFTYRGEMRLRRAARPVAPFASAV